MKATVVATMAAFTLTVSPIANAICLNPFGCEPKTLAECQAKVSKEARTEYAAKVMLSDCRQRFPDVSEPECKADAQAWVGEQIEWAGSESERVLYRPLDARSPRESCMRWFPSFYSDSLWLSEDVCVARIKADIDIQRKRFSNGFSAIDSLLMPAVSHQCMPWVRPYMNDLCHAEQAALQRCRKNNQTQSCRPSGLCG